MEMINFTRKRRVVNEIMNTFVYKQGCGCGLRLTECGSNSQ